ncbi:MAG: hypothetical protein IJR45_03240, partial [Firmicutes bacterium]|nr:hypothetical protein [Bacillota bacterium]
MCFPDEIEIVKIPKKLKEIINLYRMRKYEQADKLLEQLTGFSHQKAAIKAQIAFFNADFEHTVEYISEYFPYLCEWYSGNIKCDTIFMLEYSFVKGENTDLNKKVLNNIKNVYEILTNEQKQGKGFSQYRYYDELKRVFDGDTENTMLDNYGKKYTPPENPKRIEEVLKDFSLENKVSIGSVDDLDGFINDSRVGNMLYYMKIYTSPEDYIMVFEKLKKSKRLSMYQFLDAAMVYLYLGKKEKAEQTIVEIAKYKWIPIEETDVMPVPALSDLGAYELYTKDLFDKLAAVPCGIAPE